MISFMDARSLVWKHTPVGKVISVSLLESLHAVLAENVKAPMDAPPFDQSAMDGYAFDYASWDKQSPLRLVTMIQAGKSAGSKLKKGEVAKIFTGAPIPPGANCVVMKEKVEVKGNLVFILDPAAAIGLNNRKKASHVKAGRVVLKRGEVISAGSIAFLASIGIAKVKVFAKPRIAIVVTGDELTPPGKALSDGKVYECNSFGLIASLKNEGLAPEIVLYAKDEEKDVKKKLLEAEKKADLILFTGGVSVGDFDFVAGALLQHKVKKHFHRVKQKPGKPIFFGSKKDKVYFGLPGNPASVLTCYHVYVIDAIYKWMGKKRRDCFTTVAMNEYKKKPGLTNILKASYDFIGVTILQDQESYKLNTFVAANVLLIMDEEDVLLSKGSPAHVLEIKN